MKKGIIRLRKLPNVAVAVAIALTLGMCGISSHADSLEDAKSDRDEAQENRDDAQQVLEQLEQEQNELIQYVAQLDAQISDIQTQISELQVKEDDLNKEIEATRIELANAKAAEDDQYAAMCIRIQYLYENGEVEYIDTLLSSASFTDMLNKSEYVEQLSNYDQEQLNTLITTRESIQEYEDTLETDLREVQGVEADLEVKKASLQSTIDNKNAQIAKYDDDIDAQQALVDKYDREWEAAEALIAQYEAASIAAQQNAGNTVYDASSYSGRFMWPATQGTYISSGYGPRTSPTAGASSNHKGIDIPCPTGSDIVAAEGGTVVISQYSNSAGYYIMIDHGGGVSTVYMHNSQLCVSVGETVSKGQVIAKAGSTGYSTGSHCHFGVRIGGSYVNPINYL